MSVAATPRKGDTTLRNIRVEDELWLMAGVACANDSSDRSKVAREAYEAKIESDPAWQEALLHAQKRAKTDEAVRRIAVARYLKRVKART